MRTRFLNTDYFSSSLIETLSFLNLPVPHLAPPPPEHDLLSFLRFFDPLETLSLPIERPPIDSALSKFISAVLPHFIDSDFLDSIPDRFHQVNIQNIVFCFLVLVFNFCLLWCVVLNLFDNGQIDLKLKQWVWIISVYFKKWFEGETVSLDYICI